MSKYADIILPLRIAGDLTYAVPASLEDEIAVGKRVLVPVGAKYYAGIVHRLHDTMPENIAVRDVQTVMDEQPIVLPSQLRLWEWIADYYQCKLGEVYRAALPGGLKLESETEVAAYENEPDESELALLTERERTVYQLVRKTGKMMLKDLGRQMKVKSIMPVLKSLLEKRLLFVYEKVVESYRPKYTEYVSLVGNPSDSADEARLLEEVRRSSKQKAILAALLRLRREGGEAANEGVEKRELLREAQADTAPLQAMVKKGLVQVMRKETGRLQDIQGETQAPHELSGEQQQALERIQEQLKGKTTLLLHGVTASGKTEVYIHLMKQVVSQGKQVLFLLPEIALTTQITNRLRRVFGNRLCVYHSKFPDAERVETWNNLLRGDRYDVVVGVRSSVFLPFHRLGLIIVDEEHETTYKQYDPAPRYHARSAAIVLATQTGAKVVLGSATPSLESYNNALAGRYGLVEMLHRYRHVSMPKVECVDIRDLRHRKQMNGLFSPRLLRGIREALAKSEQVILFQNRRGYAPFMECTDCGYIPKCTDCDVTLTVHRSQGALTCHYCGHTETLPMRCPHCGSEKFGTVGFGTEKIEEELRALFPEARTARMDLDTTRSRKSYETILSKFGDRELDILIGTQMVTKGLDFRNVSLVGVLNADGMLNFPDFRAYERAFQLMAQVSGRAGRADKEGSVVIQTSDVSHPVLHQVIRNDYKGLYQTQMEERREFKYPPFYRLIRIQLKHRQESIALSASQTMAQRLRAVFGDRILGPDNPPVGRIQTLYIKQILVKIEASASSKRAKQLLGNITDVMLSHDAFKGLQITLDVDPL
ncbi:MAG: primosomal protein N' [Paludibacteraceae bacterium]|nr:primosomal protein N' [Paludibacteraceae bacterium]